MSRQVRRVPLDFDWPLREVWSGYVMPEDVRLPDCPDCAYDPGSPPTGYTPEAWAVAGTFYPHQIGSAWAKRLAWHDKIGQAEVDNLLALGRLRTLVQREPTPDNPRAWEWVSLPLAAADVNAAQRRLPPGHDALNRLILIRFRCERLGIPLRCATCRGNAEVGTDEQRAAYEAWEPTDPPTGDGWQLWETVSDGSPVSPVFADREGLVAWLTTDYRQVSNGLPLTCAEAEAFVTAGSSVGSFLVAGDRVISGEAAVADL